LAHTIHNRSFTYAPAPGLPRIIHEDNDLLVIDKPSELLSVPGKTEPDCAEARIRAYCPETLLVHRLDLPTSGVMVFHERGKKSVTRWEVLSRSAKETRLVLFPETGRSHQLRVHCLELGHPIVGDRIYAHEEAFLAADRLQLYKIIFHH